MARKMRFVSVRVCALSYCIRKLAKHSFLGNLELFSAHFKLCLVILITHSKKVTCHLTLVFCPNQRSLKTLADIEMLFQTSSLCSGSSRALSKMLEKLEMVVRGEGCFFSQQWQR